MEEKNKLPENTASEKSEKTNSDTVAATATSQPEPKAQKIGEEKSKKRSISDLFKKKEKKDEVKKPKKESAIGNFLKSINNIGMGKQAHMYVQSTATMLGAGLPLLDSLRTFQMETRNKTMKKIVGQIISDVENGSAFWKAMLDRHLFTPYDIAMVRIGEEAGNLAQNMQYLSEQREKDRGLRQQVKLAMIYPTVVVFMMTIIVMGLGLFVLPNIVQVLFSLNVDLPITTRAVIYVTKIFSDHGKVFVPLIFIGMVMFFVLGKYTRFRVISQLIVFHIPGIGRLGKEAAIARFGVVLGGLLKAGVPVIDALESLIEVTHIVTFKRFYKKLLEHVKVGDSFTKGFSAIKNSENILPVSVQQLVIAGERSGSLAESLMQVAKIYERKASETAKALPVILEPILLLIIGALVAAIAFAIIVPIYSVVGNVTNA